MEALIKKWQDRQQFYENLAEKYRSTPFISRRYAGKAQATRDCWKELNELLKSQKKSEHR